MKKLFSIFKSPKNDNKRKSANIRPVARPQASEPVQKHIENVSQENITSTSNQTQARENLDANVPAIERKHNAAISNLPAHLPDDVLELAAINDAFLQGILALQKMKLDDDLFLQAVNDLRKKYDNLRNPYVSKKIGDSQQSDTESKPKRLTNG